MKTMVLVFTMVFLAGCSLTVPVKRNFPEAPPTLMQPADPLKTLDPNDPKLSNVIETSVENMGTYHELVEKYNAWQEWYRAQKKIFQ